MAKMCRYTLEGGTEPLAEWVDDDGEWVRYDDALALVRRCRTLIAKAKQRGYERGIAEGRRREKQVHRETYYADYWAAPRAKEAPADA